MILKDSDVKAARGDEALSDEGRAQSRRGPTVLRCFEFLGNRYGFVVKTGDLIRLSEPAFDAFRLFEKGAELSEIEATLLPRYGEIVARETMGEIESLQEMGYLTPEIELTGPRTEADVRSLLRHQPRNLMFLVTEACNLACTYCYELNQGVHDRARMLKQGDARKIIDDYLENTRRKNCTITFFGGEPLLNFPVVQDVVAYSLEKGKELGKEVDFTMTTNATLVTEEIADFLARHGFHVMVSLDGDKEANDRYRKTFKGEGTYDSVVANLQILIRKMKEHGTRLPKIRATLTAENIDPVAAEEHLRSLGTHLVMIGETVGTVEKGASSYDVTADRDAAEAAHAQVNQVVLDALAKLDADPDSEPEFSPSMVGGLQAIHEEVTREHAHQEVRPSLCGVCRNMKAVTPTGDIYPCHRYVGMEKFKFGNVHEGGADPDKVAGYYRDIYGAFQEKCVDCFVRHLCGGQCPWYLSSEGGEVLAPVDSDCDQIRKSYEEQFGLYAYLLENHPIAFEKLMAMKPDVLTGKSLTEVGLPEGSTESCSH